MNSVTKFLTPETIAATLLAMRSGRKEIFLIVEGDSDVDLLAQLLELGHSNFVVCRGKENLDAVFQFAPRKGIDEGSIFLRDRDHDNVTITDRGGTKLFATDYYDIEMQLMAKRIFGRIFREYKKGETSNQHINTIYTALISAAAWLGALRLYNMQIEGSFVFDDVKLIRFINIKDLTVNTKDFVRYMVAKSRLSNVNVDNIEVELQKIYTSRSDKADLVCGKDFLEVMQLAISRHFRLCDASECEPIVLLRMLRAASTLDDLKKMSMYAHFSDHISKNTFAWTGAIL